MRTCAVLTFAIALLLGLSSLAQTSGPPQRPPLPGLGMPPGAGASLPWPQGLGRNEALTGHIAAIDKDQLMVRSPDLGEVLFWVDGKTVVRVEKFRLSLQDLRIGDPVAVRLKKVKGRGPYAVEILPHPDVKTRKLAGEQAPKPASPEPAVATDTAIVPIETPDAAGAAANAAAPAGAAATVDFPSLPAGTRGIVGTITAASGETIEVRDQQDRPQKVILTGVTLIKRAGSDAILPEVKTGDKVAVAGDRMDSGEWIAREVLVAQPPAAQAEAATAPAGAQAPAGTKPGTAAAPAPPEVSPDGLARFSGLIVAIGDEEIHVKTARGERTVLVTGITEVRRMGVRRDFSALRQGDQVDVVGDVLEGSIISAREVTVTKLAGS